MRICSVTLQNFRNIPLATLRLDARRTFFVGANGQGKTNLLEALGLCTALRSFRTADSEALIAQGAQEAGLGFEIEHEQRGETHLSIRLRSEGKEVLMDQERVGRLAEFVGVFPTVFFSSQDQQLVRGAPGLRRRWLDLSLSSADSGYLRVLQVYHRALSERNALLKSSCDGAELDAFEKLMAPAAIELIQRRAEALASMGEHLAGAYAGIAQPGEDPGFCYLPDCRPESSEAFLGVLQSARERDLRLRTSSCGPHRDDFEFRLSGHAARDFASEGQQRLLVIGLRLAQAAWLRARTGLRPVVLADDVVGELDPQRRRKFWQLLDPEAQVVASGTVLPEPDAQPWRIFDVLAGVFTEREVPGVS